jgi:hypothetical protein
MSENKPSYEQIEQELNEYKELLWQLSDEYKVNLGAAEKEVADLKEKYKLLESSKEVVKVEEKTGSISPFISQLGLPACVLNKEGQIVEYNNKFKFLIELLSFEIEDVKDIVYLLKKDVGNKLAEKYSEFQQNDEGLFQSIFRVKNAFQGIINILLRIYTFKENTDSLALFIELHKLEIEDLGIEKPRETENTQKTVEENINEPTEGEELLNLDVAVFSEKYEVYSELLKLFGKKGKNKMDIEPENLYKEIIGVFDMQSTRKKLLEKLGSQHKAFSQKFNDEFPELTTNEEKHCMLIKAGLTYKEIAAMMDISINGVKIARNRLRKKLNIENDIKTSDFINSF